MVQYYDYQDAADLTYTTTVPHATKVLLPLQNVSQPLLTMHHRQRKGERD